MNTDLDKLTKRPIQYWFEDGLGELVTAGVFILIGVVFLLQALVSSPTAVLIAGLLAMLAVGGGPWLSGALLNRLKENVIYPRTGYVKYPSYPRSRRIIGAVAALLIAAGLAALANIYEETLNWLPLIVGSAVAVLLYSQAVQVGFLRLYIESFASVMIGAGIAILGMGDLLGSGIYFLVFGILLAIFGVSAFARYLKRNPHNTHAEPGDSDEG